MPSRNIDEFRHYKSAQKSIPSRMNLRLPSGSTFDSPVKPIGYRPVIKTQGLTVINVQQPFTTTTTTTVTTTSPYILPANFYQPIPIVQMHPYIDLNVPPNQMIPLVNFRNKLAEIKSRDSQFRSPTISPEKPGLYYPIYNSQGVH